MRPVHLRAETGTGPHAPIDRQGGQARRVPRSRQPVEISVGKCIVSDAEVPEQRCRGRKEHKRQARNVACSQIQKTCRARFRAPHGLERLVRLVNEQRIIKHSGEMENGAQGGLRIPEFGHERHDLVARREIDALYRNPRTQRFTARSSASPLPRDARRRAG